MKRMTMENRSRNFSPIALAVAAALGTGAAFNPALAAEDPILLLDLSPENLDIANPPAVAVDADGDAVYAWSAVNDDPDGDPETDDAMEGVYFGRIAADGSKSEIRTVFEEEDGNVNILSVSVATDADGDSVVAWVDVETALGFATVKARRVGADGTPADETVDVSTVEEAGFRVADAAMDAAGNFVVAWGTNNEDPVLFRRYTATGSPLDTQKQANALDDGDSPQVSVGPDGHFAIAWMRDESLVVRPYSPAGNPLHDEFIVDEIGDPTVPAPPHLAVDADGDFAAGWLDYVKYTDGGLPDSLQQSVQAQRFSADGTPSPQADIHVGAKTALSSGPPIIQVIGAAFDIDGNVLVGRIHTGDSGFAPFIDKVDANGDVTSVDFPFETGACTGGEPGECHVPYTLRWDADGDLLVGYVDAVPDTGELKAYYVQRFQGPEATDLAATFDVSSSEVHPGDDVVLTLTIENLHPLNDYHGVSELAGAIGATRGVTVDLTLPEGLAFSGEIEGWTCAEPAGGKLSCSHPDALWAAGELVLEAGFEVPVDADGDYTISASVTSADTDSDTANNSDELTISVSKPDDDSGDGDGGDAGDGDTDDTPPATGGSGGGALGWLALLLAPLGLRARCRTR